MVDNWRDLAVRLKLTYLPTCLLVGVDVSLPSRGARAQGKDGVSLASLSALNFGLGVPIISWAAVLSWQMAQVLPTS